MLTQPDYPRVLEAFAASLVDDDATPVGVTAATRRRLSVYRNNVRLNRIAALADAFVNVAQLVGDDFFRAMARAYVDRTPAHSANLHEDGAGLPAFIRSFRPAEALPYLGDVAEVDWRLHQAYFAADVDGVDGTTIAELGPERFAAASLSFMPSVGLVRSDHWPIADILRMHAGGPPARLNTGGQSVLVWREAFTVQWQPLASTEARAVAALINGAAVETAFAETSADPNSLLAQLFGRRLVRAIEETHDENRS